MVLAFSANAVRELHRTSIAASMIARYLFILKPPFLTGREMQVPSVDEKTSLIADNVIVREVD